MGVLSGLPDSRVNKWVSGNIGDRGAGREREDAVWPWNQEQPTCSGPMVCQALCYMLFFVICSDHPLDSPGRQTLLPSPLYRWGN